MFVRGTAAARSVEEIAGRSDKSLALVRLSRQNVLKTHANASASFFIEQNGVYRLDISCVVKMMKFEVFCEQLFIKFQGIRDEE